MVAIDDVVEDAAWLWPRISHRALCQVPDSGSDRHGDVSASARDFDQVFCRATIQHQTAHPGRRRNGKVRLFQLVRANF